jgi:dTMP kinase
VTGRGRLVAFEGGEASGKSTQAARLAKRLGAVLTREPGGTKVGQRIRQLVLDPRLDALSARTEALLMAADRAQHVAEVIEPALARGDDVVTDRFTGSSLAYQGYGRGLDLGDLERVSSWAADGVAPDLVVLLDVPLELARTRSSARADRMEAEAVEFHRRVAEGYRALAQRDAWVVIDGRGTIAAVAERVWTAVEARLAPA